MGPMIVIRRTRGGSYLCCELDGAMFQGKIGAFRVIPFAQRKSVELPADILDLIDLSSEKLDELAEEDEEEDEYLGKDMQFHKIRIRPNYAEIGDDSDSESYVSEDEPDLQPGDTDTSAEVPAGPRRSKRLLGA